MVLPLLVQEDVEALENRVLASGVAGSVRGRADLGEPSIREVLPVLWFGSGSLASANSYRPVR
jgi:hypothetical protein